MKKQLLLFVATLLDSPSGTYLVEINFERGVSVVRKAVRM
jgi:hypothetical protein